MGERRLPYRWLPEKYPARRQHYLTYWLRVHRRTWHRWENYLAAPWLRGPIHDALVCIHTHEGAWNAETGNGYHGGLQMDSSFERTYGPEFYARYGDAGHWPVTDQLHAAYRATRTRGFTPWPNTARMCGLL